ncbi:transglutaminaseTgpA domain-containing protein [Spongiactinospora sp. 9N601]|uniref:transglutaminase family protein n=1 Tax=Spongiactinospora sp. 9N601 TaxID=3375149 RepID=UPI0037A7731E
MSGLGWVGIVRLLVAGVVAGVAGWGFSRVFAPGDLLPAVPVAAAGPVLVALLCAGRPLWLALLADVLLWPVGAAVFVYGETQPAVAARAVTDLTNSWHALLTTLLPAPGEPALLILVYTLVWAAALIGAELVTRTRTRAAPGLPAIAVFVTALLLGVDGPGSNLPVAAALLALVAALSLLADDRPPLWAAAGVPALAALAAVAMLLGPLLPVAAEPYNPRADAVPPQPVRFDSVSPLDRVSAWLRRPETDLFTVRSQTPLNWRLAVLDRYDGVRWTSSAKFRPTGGRVPDEERQGRFYTVQQTFTLAGLRDRWLPAAQRPTWVAGVPKVAADPESGSLVATADPKKGLTYQVTSRIARPEAADLDNSAATADPALLDFPEGPQRAAFARLARQAAGGAELPYQRAEALESFMRSAAKYDITAPPGHSLPGLDYFLRQSRRGTSEQFASTYALLARTLGLPSRVVVGFRPGERTDGAFHVRTGDVLAWAEVKFDGVGWLAFDPTPPRSGSKDRHDVVSAVEKDRQRLKEQLGKATENKPRPRTDRGDGDGRATPGGGPAWWLVAALAAAALAGCYLLLAAALPWWRRRRRRTAGDPGARVAGAWRQACDDLGLSADGALTAEEVTARGGDAHGDDLVSHLTPLAHISNYVRFAPEQVANEDAEEAWRRSDAVHRLIVRRTPAVRRLRRRLHPRSLRR